MDESERAEGFKVTDKRRFTATGDAREAETPQPESKESEPKKSAEPRQEPGAAETTSGQREQERSTAREVPPPPPDFSSFVGSLASTALFQLGYLRTSEDQEPRIDVIGARHTIDLLAVLEEKTRGNLTDQEKKLLAETLFQLRIAFVEATKKS